MPDFVVKSPDGLEITVTGDTPPTESDLDAIFADARQKKGMKPLAREQTWTDTAVNALPAAGGIAGGILGGIGGTAFGLGFGGVPGAVGGATLGGGAGEAAKRLINEVRGVAPADTAAQRATDIAKSAIGQGAGELIGAGVGAVAKPVLSHLAGTVMQSAVKPGVAATARAFMRGVATEDLPVVKTLLGEKINVSSGGIAKLDRILNATSDEVSQALKRATGSIYPEKAVERLGPLAERYGEQVNPEEALGAVKSAGEEFIRSRAGGNLAPATPLTLPQAQAIKTGTYRALKEQAYGTLKAPAVEAQKALARGLKEDIETEAAKQGIDLGALNAREGAAIEAKEAIGRRLAAAGNRDPVGLAWLAHNPVASVLWMMERSPAAKSLLARGLWRSAAMATGVTPQVAKLAMASLLGSSDQPEGQ